MNKKHVLFIVENNPVPSDKRVWYEASAIRNQGYDVSIISPRTSTDQKKKEILNDITIYRHPRPLEGSGILGLIIEYINAFFWQFLLCIRIYVNKPFSLVHIANPPDHTFLIVLPYKLLGVKYIFDHHDIAPETYVSKFGRKDLIYNILRWVEKLNFKCADRVISTNESYRNIALTRGGKKVSEVIVVRNGPALSELKTNSFENKWKNSFKHLVAYVGIMGKQEGLDNLLDVARYIVKEKNRTDIGFILIGKGTHLSTLKKEVIKMGLEDSVIFTGFIPYEELQGLLSHADVCVNPEFATPFSDKSTMAKILDYMLGAKPIVQFRTTEGIVTAGDAALHIENNDLQQFAEGILSLVDNDNLRKRMGDVGYKKIINELCWEKQVQNLVNAYDGLTKVV